MWFNPFCAGEHAQRVSQAVATQIWIHAMQMDAMLME